MTKPTTTAPASRGRFWKLAGIGVGVILAGFALPYLLLPGRVPPPHNLPTPRAPTDEAALLTRLAGATVVVLGLLVGTLLVLRRRLTRLPPPLPNAELQLLGATRIDARSRVYLVEARGQRLLVGADWTGVKLVVPVPSPSEERGLPCPT